MAKVWDKPITAETDWGGDASTGGLPVSGRMVQAYIKERLALASSKEDIEQFVKDYLEEIGMASDGGFVTLASEQIVKAIKDFAEGIKLNGSPLITYDAEKNAYMFPANVIAEGGIAAFSSLEEYDIPTIMDAVVTDEVTISKIGGVLQVLKAGLDKEELMAILEAEKYVDETWVKNFCVKYALAEDVVDLKSRQNITGIKNFVNGLEVGGKILKYDATKNAFILRANIIAEGGITAWGSLEGYDIPTIMDAINVDGQTIIKEDGMLKLNPNIDLGGGLDESQLEEYLATNQYAKKGDIATALIGYATQSWVTGRGYITSAALEPYAKKSTTLAGYGITDTYTKTQIDTSVNAINKSITDLRTYTDKTFVKLAVAQDITARHNFTNGLKIGGLSAYKSQEDVVFIDANVVVRGGITAWGDNEQTAPTIWDGFPCDNATIKRGADGLFYAEVQSGGIDESQLETFLTGNKYAKKDDISSALNGYATQSWVTGRGFITGITSSMVTNALGYTPLSTSGGTITATGRRQLSLQSSTDAQAALWLGTGLEQFSKGGFLQYDYSNGSIALVNFSAMANSYSGLAGLFIKRDNRITVGDANLSVEYDVLHSGNYGDYALPITGGTVNGAITINDYAKITNDLYLGGVLRNANATWLLGENAPDGTLTIGSGSYAQERCLHNYNGKLRLTAEGGVEAQLTYLDSDPTLGALDTKGVVRQVAGSYGWGIYSWVRNTGNGYIQVGSDSRYAAPEAFNLILQVLGGNVAIGGTTASEKLHVYGNLGLEGCLKVVKSTYPDIRGNGSYLTLSPDDVAGSKGSVGLYKTGDSSYEFRRVWDHYSYGTMNLGSSGYRWTTVYGVNANFSGNVVAAGNVAIGGTTASEKLHVYGNILATGAITMYYSSDKRLKQNIRKINASKTLLSLGGVYQYEYIDSEVQKNRTYGGSHYGLIYQNVKGSALDKMCFEREDGMGALNYLDANFISLIAGATMENISEIEQVKRENRELRKELEQLKQRVA